ncbi:MAG: tetratricopeptide repeat protein [Fibrobacterota bacterium]|nr:tetratricopeptide repeat protein [Fibrobacterota bacterium]QQS04647.1 MAG: tetratricopeptide repeat protein [Fibrobacterota bacterium]
MLRPALATLAVLVLASCAARQDSETELGRFSAEEMRNSIPLEQRISFARETWVQAVSLDLQGQPQMALEAMQMAAFYDPSDRWLQISMARRLRDFRRSAEALAVMRKALRMPGQEESTDWELVAGLYLEMGSKDSAEIAWNHVLELDAHSREALLGMASLAEARSEWGKAASYFGRLSLEYGPRGKSLVERAAGLWLRHGSPDSAQVLLRSRWDADHEPGFGEALARFLLTTGQPQEAVGILDTLLESVPEDAPRLELMAARALLASGQRDQALARLRTMDAVNPNDPRTLATIGAILLDMDSTQAAKEVFQRLAVHDPKNALSSYFLGLLALQRKSYDTARTHLEHSLALDSTAIDTWIRRGMLELEQDSVNAAVRVFQRFSRNWPRLPQARFLHGYALSRKANRSLRFPHREWSPPDSEPVATDLRRRAALEFDTTLAIDTNLHRARFERGSVRERLGQWDLAIEDLRQAVRENPLDANISNYLAYLFADRGIHLDEADTLIRRALQADPDNPAYLDTRGWLRMRQGRFAEALEDVERSISLGEDELTILVHKATILERLKRKSQARELWKKVLDRDPGHPAARQGWEQTK